jgi:HTH-type transcriptional regulator/antitoxin HigA
LKNDWREQIMTGVAAQQKWMLNWAVHPGAVLREHLEVRGLSLDEFAGMSGLSSELVSAIIGERRPVTAEIANDLERVLGLRAYIWTEMQAEWDRFQAGTAATLIPKLPD